MKLDNDSCGGCGIVCGTGESCLGGICTCHLTTCVTDAGESVCTDPESDPLNCGDCGAPCPYNMNCALGGCWDCGEDPYRIVCDTDAGLECVNTAQDYDHCGGCSPCTPPATECINAACQ